MADGSSIGDSHSDVPLMSSTQFDDITAEENCHEFLIQSDAVIADRQQANALALCRKYILSPYQLLLKVIGWRRFGSKRDKALCSNVCNFLYPMFIFVMLIFACVAHISSCFSRTKSQPPSAISKSKYSILQCGDNMATSDILSYLLILASYLGAFYVFRVSEAEHLSSLSETVLISYNFVSNKKKRTGPVSILLIFLVVGVTWFIFSVSVRILRFFALGLHKETTIIEWFTQNSSATDQANHLLISQEGYTPVHYLLASCSLFGFFFFDLLYVAVVINYCSQCQLLVFYVFNVKDKLLNKKYRTLHDACKEIYRIFEYLKVLNSKLAYVMTMILFIFAFNAVQSYKNLVATEPNDKENIVLGFLNVIQWLAAMIFPIALATRFTAVSKSLRNVSHQISCRPFIYKDTPDLDLLYFLNFVDSAKYQARLAFIPMYPSLVLGFSVIALLLITLSIGIPHPSLHWF